MNAVAKDILNPHVVCVTEGHCHIWTRPRRAYMTMPFGTYRFGEPPHDCPF
jgi:hypothetical protein